MIMLHVSGKHLLRTLATAHMQQTGCWRIQMPVTTSQPYPIQTERTHRLQTQRLSQMSLSERPPELEGQPTDPSSFRLIRALTSSANSSGSLLKTSAQKPEMMVATASSASMPLCWK